jgi:hypothetical protein
MQNASHHHPRKSYVHVLKKNAVKLSFLGAIAAVCIIVAILLILWRRDTSPVLSVIGISKGTLETPLEELQFSERFDVADRNLVGVAVFKNVVDGTHVMATWFSPDERTIPLGRSTLIIASGATIVRFSIGAPGTWKPSPYQLRIDAAVPLKPTPSPLEKARRWVAPPPRTASGSVRFFIGMTDAQVQAYNEELEQWKKEDAERQRKFAEEEARRSASGTLAPDAASPTEIRQ